MTSTQVLTIEDVINFWNGEFSDHVIEKSHLTDPLAFLKVLVLILNKLGIETDAIIAIPPEESQNSHIAYYKDLLPVINITRIVNHFMSIIDLNSPKISIQTLMQPVLKSSHSILFILFNLVVFNEEQLQNIAPSEEELFHKSEKVKILQDQKVKLLELMNERAQERGERPERLEKLEQETKRVQQETKVAREQRDENRQVLDAILNENRNEKIALEQKKSQLELFQSEAKRLRALRVTDVDEIKTQMAQSAQEEQEVKERLSTLEDILMQKENSLKNLQTMKPHLENSNSTLKDIMNYVDWMKEFQVADPESDNVQRELEALQSNLSKLQTSLGDLRVSRNEKAQMSQQAEAERELNKKMSYSKLMKTEEETVKCLESSKKAAQRIEELKHKTQKYKEKKTENIEILSSIETMFRNELTNFEELLLSKGRETEKHLQKKILRR